MDSWTLGALLQIPIESQKLEVLRDLTLACFVPMRKAVDKMVNVNFDDVKPYYRHY